MLSRKSPSGLSHYCSKRTRFAASAAGLVWRYGQNSVPIMTIGAVWEAAGPLSTCDTCLDERTVTLPLQRHGDTSRFRLFPSFGNGLALVQPDASRAEFTTAYLNEGQLLTRGTSPNHPEEIRLCHSTRVRLSHLAAARTGSERLPVIMILERPFSAIALFLVQYPARVQRSPQRSPRLALWSRT